MASFHDRSAGGMDSRAMSRKGTTIDTAEVEKLRNRIQECEKILMGNKLTKKKLGDPEGDAAASAAAAAAAAGSSVHSKSGSTITAAANT
jgi:hypothetical protein